MALSRRLADRLRSQATRGIVANENVAFIGGVPGGPLLLDRAFTREDLASAKRILVLGPYFDDDLGFLAELRKRAPRAALSVAIQPKHAIIKRPSRLPSGVRFCDADALALRRPPPFIHAKAIVLERERQTVAAIGSANPSAPAWLGDKQFGNFEAMIAIRGDEAKQATNGLGLDQLWNAPTVSKKQLEDIELRSNTAVADENVPSAVTVPGLWRDGWVEAQLEKASGKISAVRTLAGARSSALTFEANDIERGKIRFSAPEPGAFAVDIRGRQDKVIVIASSAVELGRSLVSGPAARLIDELGRLSDGTAPGEELLNLCEKVLLEPEDDTKATLVRPKGKSSPKAEPETEGTAGPRGISIHDAKNRARKGVTLSLDISAIITLLLKELEGPPKDKTDPTVADDESELDGSEDGRAATEPPEWEDVVRAIRPRVKRLLNRLSARLEEDHSAKWKYERVLVTLALLKRLRKFHPGTAIPFSGVPQRLVDEEHLRLAFKLAMRCLFARVGGVVGVLERMGGLDSEYEMMGRALLLWAAYEAGADVAQPKSFRIDPEDLRALQADRADALISAIAASASSETLARARREIFDRGEWTEPCDRVDNLEAWFRRHTRIGQTLHDTLTRSRPAKLPVLTRAPSIQDILVWKQEPGWPRLPEVVSGRVVHLADVGDEEPIKIAQQFVQPLDVERLGISELFAPQRFR
jgi:hypothetical protein